MWAGCPRPYPSAPAQLTPARIAGTPARSLLPGRLRRADRAVIDAELLDRLLRERQVDDLLIARLLAFRDVADPLHQGCGGVDMLRCQPVVGVPDAFLDHQ